MFYKVRSLIVDRVASWAAKNGVPAPASLPLAPAPAHVDADVALAWPLSAAKTAKRKPLDLATELSRDLGDPMLAAATPAPPGFVNIRLSQKALLDNLAGLLREPGRYGTPDNPRGGKVLIEFVSANPTGPLHLASGRAATLGDSLARILRRLGTNVFTEFYVNDAGRQVELLGQSVKAKLDELSTGKTVELTEGYKGEYIGFLAGEIMKLATTGVEWSASQCGDHAIKVLINSQQLDMERFRVQFDNWYRESNLHSKGALVEVQKYLESRGMVYQKEGATWLGTSKGESSEDDKDRVLVKSDGRTTYFLADIAYHKDKFDRGWETLVDILGADHHGYVGRMKAAVAALGKPPEAFHAIVHQLVHLKRGAETVKMSKRAGDFVTLRELMDEVGVDACRYFFAMHSPNTHMEFDLELAKKRSQENPVFYVQYVHARIASIFREAKEKGIEYDSKAPVPEALLAEPESRALLRELFWFPRTLEACAVDLSPHHLHTYLTGLSALYHSFYEKCRVVDTADMVTSKARLALCAGVMQTIKEGLDLIGVSAPDKM